MGIPNRVTNWGSIFLSNFYCCPKIEVINLLSFTPRQQLLEKNRIFGKRENRVGKHPTIENKTILKNSNQDGKK